MKGISNKQSIFKMLGASNHTEKERQKEDYYATDPIAVELLLDLETFNKDVWECACGEKHMSNVLEKRGFNVRSSDIIKRCDDIEEYDFLKKENIEWNGDIITNPPYKYAEEFIYKALQIIPTGNKVAMFLRLQFLEGKKRKQLFTNFPPSKVLISSSRIICAKNADFEKMKQGGGSAVAFAWFIWEKGFQGDPIIKWFN
jgi:hypothetical protein